MAPVQDDEWEVIDEEKDIEVQNVRMGNLELAPIEDSTRPATKETVDKGNEEPDDNKKVWAAKAPEPKGMWFKGFSDLITKGRRLMQAELSWQVWTPSIFRLSGFDGCFLGFSVINIYYEE